MPTDDEVEFAWACGLFEGEGCIYIRPTVGGTLSLVNTDEDIVNRFKEIVGIGSISIREGWNKPVFVWETGSYPDIESLLMRMMPFLGERRKCKVEELLEHKPKHGPYGDNNSSKTHCPKGHEYALTAYRRPAGGRVCVACYPSYKGSRERQLKG